MSQRLPEDLQNSYVKIMTLIDLCLFDIQSLGHDYSKIAAAAMYHLMSPNHLALFSSGFRFGEIKQTVDWMSPYADAIRNIEETIKIKRFSKIDLESCHNIQLNCQYLELLVTPFLHICIILFALFQHLMAITILLTLIFFNIFLCFRKT